MKDPKRYIRKFFYDTLDGIVVDGKTINVYDYRVPHNEYHYILMTTQQREENDQLKCAPFRYNSHIVLDIVTIYDNYSGSRLLADLIQEKVLQLTQNIVISGFDVEDVETVVRPDMNTMTTTQSIFRNLLQYNIQLSEN